MPAKNQSSTQKQDQVGMEALKHKDQVGMKLLKRTQYQNQAGMFKGRYGPTLANNALNLTWCFL